MPLNSHKPLYQPWNEEEFRSDMAVQEMNHIERWIYRSLLQSAFFCATRPYLPDDDKQLWRLAGCDDQKQWGKHKAKVVKMFQKFRDGDLRLLKQKRLEMDWLRERERRQVLSEKGVKGAAAKKAKAVAGGQAQVKHRLSTELDLTELNRTEPNCTELPEETMSLKTRITDTCRKVLHVRLRPEDNQWPEVTSLARVHGPDAVLEAFESWAESKRGEDLTYPLSKFVEKADGIIGGEISLKTDDRLQPLILKLVNSCDGVIDFEQKQVLAIGKLLCDNSPEEIEAAFREFFNKYTNDSFNLTGRKFVETAPQYLSLLKYRKTEATRQARILEAARTQSESEGAKVVQKMDEAEVAIEDRLGG